MQRLEYVYEFGGDPFDVVVSTEGEADIAAFMAARPQLAL
jgi:hypothetical protein